MIQLSYLAQWQLGQLRAGRVTCLASSPLSELSFLPLSGGEGYRFSRVEFGSGVRFHVIQTTSCTFIFLSKESHVLLGQSYGKGEHGQGCFG